MGEKPKNRVKDRVKHLIPFKKGESGNPNGAPKGKRLKTFAMELLEKMSDEEKAKFLEKIDPRIVWEMAEGKAKQDVEMSGEVTSKIISIDE